MGHRGRRAGGRPRDGTRARPGVSAFTTLPARTRAVLTLAALFAPLAVPPHAPGGPAEVPGALPPSVLRDVGLTVRARQALRRDKELAPLNLGVKVREGVATLWGPV